MSIHYTLFWLLFTAAFGKSDLGWLGIVVSIISLVALAVAVIAILRKPSWSALWLLLPMAVTHVFLQFVVVWLIGDHHETFALSLYALALLAAVGIATYAARANRAAVVGTAVFAMAYGWFAYDVSLFVFWNGFH